MYLNFPHVWPRKVSLHDIIPSHPFPCLLSLTTLLSSFLFLLYPRPLHLLESFLCAVLVTVCSPAVTHGNVCRLLACLFYQPYPVICLSLNYSRNETLSAWLSKCCFSCLGFSFLNVQTRCCFGAFPVSSFLSSADEKKKHYLFGSLAECIHLPSYFRSGNWIGFFLHLLWVVCPLL